MVSYDTTSGYVTLGMTTHNGVHPGRGLLRFDAIATDPPEFRLLAGWIGEMYQANAPTPAYPGGNELRIVFNGLDVLVEYVALIETR